MGGPRMPPNPAAMGRPGGRPSSYHRSSGPELHERILLPPLSGRISQIYLADTALDIGIIAALAWSGSPPILLVQAR